MSSEFVHRSDWREEIMNLARACWPSDRRMWSVDGDLRRLERFAALVADAEREACAEVAEQTVCDTHLPTGVKIYGGRAAKAIRARREKR